MAPGQSHVRPSSSTMRVPAQTFRAIEAMIAARRPGVDEVEAVYAAPSAGGPQFALNREAASRLLAHLFKSGGGAAVTPEETVDVAVDGAAASAALQPVRLTLAAGAGTPAPLHQATVRAAVVKSRLRPPVELAEYRLRFNAKSETPADGAARDAAVAALAQPARPGLRRTYRLKRRFSFPLGGGVDGEGRPVARARIDITAVRQLAQQRGEAPATVAQLAAAPERYELELELLDAAPSAAATAQFMLSQLYALLAVLDGVPLQLGARVLGVSQLEAVMADYAALVSTRAFVGPDPVTLERWHLCGGGGQGPQAAEPAGGGAQGAPLLGGGYTVTDKADGERRLLFVASDRAAYTINNRGFVRDAGRACRTMARCLLDGEQVGGAFYAFDAYFADGADVRPLPLWADDDACARPSRSQQRGGAAAKPAASEVARRHTSCADRLSAARRVVADLAPAGALTVAVKEFRRVAPPGVDGLAAVCRAAFERQRSGRLPYHVDGLVFTPAAAHVPPRGGRWREVLKWKPPEQNTIDFAVRLRPPDELAALEGGGGGGGGGPVMCRVAELLVASDPWLAQPVTARDYLTGAAAARWRRLGPDAGRRQFVAARFRPPGETDDDVGIAYLRFAPGDAAALPRCASGEPVLDGAVVEFAYDAGPTDPALPLPHPARWRPLRVRYDKVEQQAATGVVRANAAPTAASIWSTIRRPVSEAALCDAGALRRLCDDERRQQPGAYYVAHTEAAAATATATADPAKGPRARGARSAMQRFHNAVKRDVLLMRFPGANALGRSVFDFGCGRAGDLQKWVDMGARRVMGVDKFASNLYDPSPEAAAAYVRLLRAEQAQRGGATLPTVVLLPMDASQPIATRAYVNQMDEASGDRDVAAVLWGHTTLPDAQKMHLERFHGYASARFDLASCMFAVHYFFESPEALAQFARNVGSVLRPGGHFVGCCLDGARVAELLAASPDGVASASDGSWRITRRYDGDAAAAKAPAGSAPAGSAPAGRAPAGRAPAVRAPAASPPSAPRRVDVYVASIGQELPEWLVDYDELAAALRKHGGLAPPSAERCAELGLLGGRATGTFDEAADAGVGGADVVRELRADADAARYSFLNRWFVFERLP